SKTSFLKWKTSKTCFSANLGVDENFLRRRKEFPAPNPAHHSGFHTSLSQIYKALQYVEINAFRSNLAPRLIADRF
ncbi:MAG: hypothetical protein ABGX43_07625, partial [Nitrospinaceae bacterium]